MLYNKVCFCWQFMINQVGSGRNLTIILCIKIKDVYSKNFKHMKFFLF